MRVPCRKTGWAVAASRKSSRRRALLRASAPTPLKSRRFDPSNPAPYAAAPSPTRCSGNGERPLFWMTIPVAVCSTGLGRVSMTASRAAPRQAPACTWPSGCTTKMPNCSVAKSFSQLSRIFSKTGVVSATELLMTRNTSDVAVCWASASCVSLNSRTFSMAIRAWSANVRTSSISRSE